MYVQLNINRISRSCAQVPNLVWKGCPWSWRCLHHRIHQKLDVYLEWQISVVLNTCRTMKCWLMRLECLQRKIHHDAVLSKLKTEFSTATTLSYFYPKMDTPLYIDASPVGLCAALTQTNAPPKVISWTLTPTDQRYSQTGCEALAVIWAWEYFNIYVFGASFKVYTGERKCFI